MARRSSRESRPAPGGQRLLPHLPYGRSLVLATDLDARAGYASAPESELRNRLPSFPHLSLQEFLVLTDLRRVYQVPQVDPKVDVGSQTIQFIQMFFRNADRVLKRLDEEFLDSDEYKRYLPEIRFLRTERLNDDLVAFLAERGYSAERLEVIREMPPVNTTASAPPIAARYAPMYLRTR